MSADGSRNRLCLAAATMLLNWLGVEEQALWGSSHIVGRWGVGKGQLKCGGTRAETRFRLSAKRTRPLKSAGGVSSVDYWQPR